MKKYLYITLFILIAVAFISVDSCIRNKKEAQRIAANFHAATSDTKFYRTKDSISVASVEVLNLRLSELNNANNELTKQAKMLNLQIRRLQSAAKTKTTTEYIIETRWKDSIRVIHGATDTIRCVDYQDEYLTFIMCDEGTIATPHIQHRDVMYQFIHRVPRFHFLFIRIGTKAIRQDITFKNPNTEIEYTKFINFVKK